MNKLSLVSVAISSMALALPPVHPALPPVAHIDTETVTNVPFAAWQEHVGKFKFSLACRTTATMRDALLPKLMSGEIDVEKVVVA